MKIILTTPFFPPDTEDIAVYSKRLARELVESFCDVSIVAYGDLPESVDFVPIVTISKKYILPWRLFRFFFSLFRIARGASVILSQNTLASGLPSLLVGKLRKIPVLVYFHEDEVSKYSPQNRLRYFLQKIVLNASAKIFVPNQSLSSVLEKGYGIRREKNLLLASPLPAPVFLPFHVSVNSKKIVLIADKNEPMFREKFELLQSRLPDVEIVMLPFESSRAEKWYHLVHSIACVYTSSMTDSPLLALAHTSRTPCLLLDNAVLIQTLFARLSHDFDFRESLVMEVNETTSWKNHVAKILSTIERIV